MMLLLTALLVILGATFILISAIGVVRFPDVFMRMHASTKAGVLGSSFILLAVVVHYQDLGVTARMIATILFLYLTTPVAAHAIGRAAYFAGTPMWKGTYVDELRDGRQVKLVPKPRNK